MNQQSEHLSDAQIENYGDLTSGSGPDAEAEVEKHLAKCSSCSSRLLDFQRARLGLLLDAKPEPTRTGTLSGDSDSPTPSSIAEAIVNTDSTPDCPSEDDIRQLAAGLLPDDVAAKLTRHAAVCDHCGRLLKIYQEDFSGEFDEEEQAALASTQGFSASWQRKTVQRMMAAAGGSAGTEINVDAEPATGEGAAVVKARGEKPLRHDLPERTGWRLFSWKRALVPATAAICGIAAFGVWYYQVRETPERVEKLLAQAYTEQRTLEMRWPGAAHSNYKQTLSGDSESLLNSPESLRQAANLIDSKLKKNPDDPLWLVLSARLNLLDWRYKPALAALDKIEDPKVVDSADMRMTRALALYEQAQWEPERQDRAYGEIINLMGKALRETPDNSTALFNRALACEKIHAYECAITDYERLLKEKNQEGWSGEAKDHLNRIQEKKTSEH